MELNEQPWLRTYARLDMFHTLYRAATVKEE